MFHSELWGTREEKYENLWKGPEETTWTELKPSAPHFGFEPWDHATGATYGEGFSTRDLFLSGGTGVVTKRDNLTIHETEDDVWQAVQDMINLPEAAMRRKYDLPDDVRDWRYEWARKDVADAPSRTKIQPISYRPFDKRYIYFTGQSRGFVGWPVEKLMRHFVAGENIGLATARSNKNPVPDHFFVTDVMMETKFAESSTQSCVFPLYLYPAEDDLDQERRINFDPKLFGRLRKLATDTTHGKPDELDVFDYIYGVLHSPDYRKSYAEFLKIDFPRIPWPSTPKTFWNVSDKGRQLRLLHLLDPKAVGSCPYPFKGDGDGTIVKARHEGGRIWINETQFFDKVPECAWDLSIGGYQPARKWLKDRRKKQMTFDDVKHYQRIVRVLVETDRIMNGIDLKL